MKRTLVKRTLAVTLLLGAGLVAGPFVRTGFGAGTTNPNVEARYSRMAGGPEITPPFMARSMAWVIPYLAMY